MKERNKTYSVVLEGNLGLVINVKANSLSEVIDMVKNKAVDVRKLIRDDVEWNSGELKVTGVFKSFS